MAKRDARVAAYIARAPELARPILKHLRATVHAACPAVEETLKWGHPHFMYHGMLCMMSAFTRHCAFGFWKKSLVFGARPRRANAMGQFGRVTALADLPARAVLRGLVRRAMALNEAGAKSPRPARPRRRAAPTAPADLRRALARAPAARATFVRLSPSGQREYVEWLAEAKRTETRERRLTTAVMWLAEGKGRNWRYQRPAARR
jgi:uncharacterized protein YdeI (YjbR/CyaY-like superfamily)